MASDKLLNYCLENLEGTVLVESWGKKRIFYNPYHVLQRLYCSPTKNLTSVINIYRSEIWFQGTYRI